MDISNDKFPVGSCGLRGGGERRGGEKRRERRGGRGEMRGEKEEGSEERIDEGREEENCSTVISNNIRSERSIKRGGPGEGQGRARGGPKEGQGRARAMGKNSSTSCCHLPPSAIHITINTMIPHWSSSQTSILTHCVWGLCVCVRDTQ